MRRKNRRFDSKLGQSNTKKTNQRWPNSFGENRDWSLSGLGGRAQFWVRCPEQRSAGRCKVGDRFYKAFEREVFFDSGWYFQSTAFETPGTGLSCPRQKERRREFPLFSFFLSAAIYLLIFRFSSEKQKKRKKTLINLKKKRNLV